MTMTELIDTVASETGVTKADTKFMLNSIFEVMSNELASGGCVRLPQFGYFHVGTVEAYDAVNPLAGGMIHHDQQRRVRFKPAMPLKDKLKG